MIVNAIQAAQRTGPRFHPALLSPLAVAQQWASSSQLSLEAIAAARQTFRVKQAQDRHFMYVDPGTPDKLAVSGIGTAFEFVDMDAHTFVHALRSQQSGAPPYHYYTAPVHECVPELADSVCHEWPPLVVDPKGAALDPSASPSYPSVLGTRNTLLLICTMDLE